MGKSGAIAAIYGGAGSSILVTHKKMGIEFG